MNFHIFGRRINLYLHKTKKDEIMVKFPINFKFEKNMKH